jgi:polysaccharide export outer membrane protein
MRQIALLTLLTLEFALGLLAQQAAQTGAQSQSNTPQTGQAQTTAPAETPAPGLRPSYVLRPGDKVRIQAMNVEDFGETPYTIDENGDVKLPLIEKVHAGDLSVAEFEAEVAKRLATFVRQPQVIVSVIEYRTDPIFVVGSFVRPGVHPLQGQRRLVETLTTLGGLQPNTSRRLKITRRLDRGAIPLPNAVVDKAANVSYVEINLSRLMETVNPAEDIVLQPYDVISAAKTEMVFVNGEVTKPGGFELNEQDALSVLQVLSLAGGLTPDAAAEKATVLRPVLNTSRRAEIPIDISRIQSGRANDFPLLPRDVLLIPRTRSKRAAFTRTLLVIAPAMATAVVVAMIR